MYDCGVDTGDCDGRASLVAVKNPQTEMRASRRPGRPFSQFEGDSLSREQAVSKALEIVSAEGLAGLTMQALAKSLNVSRAPIYALFSSRAQLVEEIIDVVLSRIFLDNLTDHADWRDALREIALCAFNTYRAYPGTASHLSRSGFPDTDVGLRSARLLSGLMRKAGAPAELIPTLIFASSSMIAGADLEFAGQKARDSLGGKAGEGRESLERRRGRTLPLKELDMAMFLEANEIVLLGIEALIELYRERA